MPWISPGGRLLATIYGSTLTLLDGRSGDHLADVELGHEASALAWAPSSSRCAVSGHGGLTVVEPGRPATIVATTSAAPPLWRLACSDDPPMVLGVVRTSEHETALALWDGDELRPWADPFRLGACAPFSVRLDGSTRRVVLGGRRGDGPFDGGGERFSAAYEIGHEIASLFWEGEGLSFHPDGYLFPLPGERLGVHDATELVVLDLPQRLGEPATTVSRTALPQPEGVVGSPRGSYVAWLTDGWIRAARLADGELTTSVRSTEEVGAFPAVAVDDDGSVTLAWSGEPDVVRVFGVDASGLRLRGEVCVPAEAA